MPTSFPDSLNQPPTSTAPDPTASPALTPWASTSFTLAVAPRSSLPPRALVSVGSSIYLPQHRTTAPIHFCVAAVSVQDPAAESQRRFSAGPLSVQDTAAGTPRSLPPGLRFAHDTVAGTPRSFPLGHRFAQDPAVGSPHSLPVGPRLAQDPTVDPLYSVPVGHVSALTSIAESPSSSEKATASTGAPPGLVSRPPVVSPSPTSSVSVPTAPRASSGLISSRTRHRSAAAARTPRTPADYGFGRRTLAAATPKPPSTHGRPPTLRSRPPLRPSAARRKTAWNLPPPSSATGPGGTPQPFLRHYPPF